MRPRRPVLAALLVLAASCGGEPEYTTAPPGEEPERPTPPAGFLFGGDVSALGRLEEAGATYTDGGTPATAIQALRAHGMNAFRLRLFVAPDYSEVQVNDLPYTIALAQRVKASGAKLILDFHYSDTWADPSHQYTPAAWDSLDIDTLEDTVEAYSADVIAQLKAAGALPDVVQIGNEIDAGLLWPLGRIGGSGYDQPENFARFGRLLKAGIRGVRAGAGAGANVRILIHYSGGGNDAGARWFFDHVQGQGVDWDVIGLSYYPWWHGRIGDLTTTMNDLAARYSKDVMVVETAYPWRTGWSSGGDASNDTWPMTRAGQQQFLEDVVDAVARVPDGRGQGVIWWYPEAIPVSGVFVWGGGAVALFDASGEVLPAADAF